MEYGEETTPHHLDRFAALLQICNFADVMGGCNSTVSKSHHCFPFPCRPFGHSLVPVLRSTSTSTSISSTVVVIVLVLYQ
jgi:hypothetical protein